MANRVKPENLEHVAKEALQRALQAQHGALQPGHLPRRPIICGIIAYPSLDAKGELEVHDLAIRE